MTVVAGTWSHNNEQKEQTPGQKHLFLHHGEGELLKRNSILTLSGAMDTLIWSFVSRQNIIFCQDFTPCLIPVIR